MLQMCLWTKINNSVLVHCVAVSQHCTPIAFVGHTVPHATALLLFVSNRHTLGAQMGETRHILLQTVRIFTWKMEYKGENNGTRKSNRAGF
jgi:hypothetical protein